MNDHAVRNPVTIRDSAEIIMFQDAILSLAKDDFLIQLFWSLMKTLSVSAILML